MNNFEKIITESNRTRIQSTNRYKKTKRNLNEGFFSDILNALKGVTSQFKSYLDYNKKGSPISLDSMNCLKDVEKSIQTLGDTINKAQRDECIADDVYSVIAGFINTYGDFTKELSDKIGPLIKEYNQKQEDERKNGNDEDEETENASNESLTYRRYRNRRYK